jgi:hypothetical protein
MPRKAKLFSNAEYLQIYDDLFAGSEPGNTALPFIPLIPAGWVDRDVKIMWCGGATNGWGEKDASMTTFDLIGQEEEDKNRRSELFKESSRDFWRVQRKCLGEIGLNDDNAIWNNIYKVGGLQEENRGVPNKPLRKRQQELCIRAFELELQILKPDIVVLHVGNLVDEILHDIAGPWADWNLMKSNEKNIAGHKIHEGVNFIWMSRAYLGDDEYCKAFERCFNNFGKYQA